MGLINTVDPPFNEFFHTSNKSLGLLIFEYENSRIKLGFNEIRFQRIRHYIEQKYWFPPQIIPWFYGIVS